MTSAPTTIPPEAAFLIEAAGSAPSADNSQPWCFEWDGHTLTGRVLRRGGFPADYHATTLALGAAAENLARALSFLGLDASSWYLGPPAADGVFACGPVARRERPIDRTIAPPWTLRHTNRLPYLPDIDTTATQALAACRVNMVSIQTIVGPNIARAADWVRRASEIRFQTREVNEWFAASLRYGNSPEEMNDGLHVSTLALPPGGTSLLKLMSDWRRMEWLNRFRAYKLFAAIEATNFQKTPLVIAILGPSDKAATFDAGRCLQHVWLKSAAMGLAGQPYYVVSDLLNRLELGKVPPQCLPQARELRERLRQELSPHDTLHCLLRVGKPAGNTPHSGRLPLKDIMCNATKRS